MWETLLPLPTLHPTHRGRRSHVKMHTPLVVAAEPHTRHRCLEVLCDQSASICVS